MGINVPDYTDKNLIRSTGAALINLGGFKFIRFPGGSPADSYLWDNSYDKYPFFKPYRGDYDNGVQTDDIIDLCKKTGAEPLIQVNYAMFVLYGQEAGTDLAVRWYQYFKDHGVTVKYWELGNENSGGWELPQSSKDCRGFDGPSSTCQNANGEQYGKDFAYLSAAMRKLDPDVKLGAWLETNEREDGAGQRKAKWDSLLMPQLKSQHGLNGQADWLNIHTYFWQPMDWGKGAYTPYSPKDLYSHDNSLLTQTKSDFEAIVGKYFFEGTALPVAITEWNIDQAFPHADPQVDQHISALVTADLIGQAVSKGGVQALNYFALLDGWKTDSCNVPPCPGPADLGMVSTGQPGVKDGTPRPALFSFAMWNQTMANQMILAEVSGSSSVTAYASSFPSGEMGLIVINKESFDLTLNIAGVQAEADVRGWMLTPSDSSASPLDYAHGSSWNGVGPADGKTGGPDRISDIHPYGAKASRSNVEVFVPKVSVVGMVFYPSRDASAVIV